MLAYLEHLFHENTKKTIVSLKQLCNQIEAADHAAAPFAVAPSFCSRLCGGASAAEKAGNVRASAPGRPTTSRPPPPDISLPSTPCTHHTTLTLSRLHTPHPLLTRRPPFVRWQALLQDKIKAVRTYAVALLLEHGFTASDLVEFASRGRKSSTYVNDHGSSSSPEAQYPNDSPPKESPRKLSLDNAGEGVMMG